MATAYSAPGTPAPSEADDLDLADEETTGRLLDSYRQRAFNLAYRLVRRPEDAADAVQDAYVQAIRATRSSTAAPREPGRFGSWLLKIVANAALAQLRRRRSGDSLSLDALNLDLPAGTDDQPLRAVVEREERGDVLQALLALPDTQRAALTLREYQGLSYDEIGELLGLDRGATTALLYRARCGFREAYEGVSARRGPVGCTKLAPLISAMLDHELESETWAHVEDHVKGCPHCRRQLRQLRRAQRLHTLIPLLAPPASLSAAAALGAVGGTGVASAVGLSGLSSRSGEIGQALSAAAMVAGTAGGGLTPNAGPLAQKLTAVAAGIALALAITVGSPSHQHPGGSIPPFVPAMVAPMSSQAQTSPPGAARAGGGLSDSLAHTRAATAVAAAMPTVAPVAQPAMSSAAPSAPPARRVVGEGVLPAPTETGSALAVPTTAVSATESAPEAVRAPAVTTAHDPGAVIAEIEPPDPDPLLSEDPSRPAQPAGSSVGVGPPAAEVAAAPASEAAAPPSPEMPPSPPQESPPASLSPPASPEGGASEPPGPPNGDSGIDLSAVDLPPVDVAAVNVPPIDVPSVDVPAVDAPPVSLPVGSLPPIDLPAVDLPPVDVPAADLPAVDLPPIDVPAIDVPEVDLPIPGLAVVGSVVNTLPPIDPPPVDVPSLDPVVAAVPVQPVLDTVPAVQEGVGQSLDRVHDAAASVTDTRSMTGDAAGGDLPATQTLQPLTSAAEESVTEATDAASSKFTGVPIDVSVSADGSPAADRTDDASVRVDVDQVGTPDASAEIQAGNPSAADAPTIDASAGVDLATSNAGPPAATVDAAIETSTRDQGASVQVSAGSEPDSGPDVGASVSIDSDSQPTASASAAVDASAQPAEAGNQDTSSGVSASVSVDAGDQQAASNDTTPSINASVDAGTQAATDSQNSAPSVSTSVSVGTGSQQTDTGDNGASISVSVDIGSGQNDSGNGNGNGNGGPSVSVGVSTK